MPAHQTLGATARMKRSGAELPLCTWSGCGGRLNRVAVATGKRGGGGDAARALLRFVKMFRVGCSNAVASIGRGPICIAERCQSGGC